MKRSGLVPGPVLCTINGGDDDITKVSFYEQLQG